MYRELNLGLSINKKFKIIAFCPGNQYLDLEGMSQKAFFDSLVDHFRENYVEGEDFDVSNEHNWVYNQGCRFLGVKPRIVKKLSERFCGEILPGFKELVNQYEAEYMKENEKEGAYE